MSNRPALLVWGFTLLELLVVMVVIALLAVATIGAAAKIRGMARDRIECARYHRLGQGVIGWSMDNHGQLPRSTHSAFAHGQVGWQREILPVLGYPDTRPETFSLYAKEVFGIDPTAQPARRPAINVYFELEPDNDDYEGIPVTWHTLANLPFAGTTVLLVCSRGTADHVMAHYFSGRVEELPAITGERETAPVLWADGRATMEKAGTLFDASAQVDRFHPQKAGQ